MSCKLKIKSSADFSRIQRVLSGEKGNDGVVLYELFSDIEEQVLDAMGDGIADKGTEDYKMQRHIRYMSDMGYDYVNIGRNWDFEKCVQSSVDTGRGQRDFVTSQTFLINNREDFEKYQWPDIESLDYSRFENVNEYLSKGMKVIALCAGILENVMLLLGHEGISYMLFDDPDLVEDVFKEVAERIIKYYDIVASFDCVGALSLSDDMGFKTQTMLSPDVYRKCLFGWHKKLVDVIHSHDKFAILHSCGRLDNVMDDIIACGWDAKHSFEDEIMPIWQAQELWGDKISLLGGFDMHKICTMNPTQVSEHTRLLIDKCNNGRWALGTGNSVADYVPVENFIAMVSKGLEIE